MSTEVYTEQELQGEELLDEALVTQAIIPNDEMRKQILEYLRDEADKAVSELSGRAEKWSKWRRQREARPETLEKSDPWPGASNVSVPLAAINTNAAAAKLINMFGSKEPFWTIVNDDRTIPEAADAATKVFEFLVDSPTHLNLHTINQQALYECASLGTLPVKVAWVTEQYMYKDSSSTPGGSTVKNQAGQAVSPTTGDGSSEQRVKVRHDGPALIAIPNEDFLTRPHWPDLQKAPWIAHVVHKYWHEIQQLATQMIYFPEALEEIENKFRSDSTDLEEDVSSRTATEVLEQKIWDIHEFHVYWDVDEDGIQEDLILTVHLESGTFLRERFNDLGVRPYEMLSYMPVFNQLYGIGVGHMCEGMQDEVDAMHNMRIDGAKIGALRMFAVKRNSPLRPSEKMYPGKLLFVDNPQEDIVPIQSGEVYGSSLQAEMVAKQYAERYTGMGDYQTGFEDSSIGSRATVGGTMFLAQQGGKMFGPIGKGLEQSYSRIGMLVLFIVVKYRVRFQKDLDRFDEETRQGFMQILQMNVDEIPTKFRFRVETTEQDKSEEAVRQQLLTLVGLYTTYMEKIVQLGMMMDNPQLQQAPNALSAALNAFTGASRMMEKILHGFDIHDVENYLPDYKMTEALEAQMSQMMGGANAQSAIPRPVRGPVQGGPGSPGGAGAVGGMGPAGSPTS